MRAKDFRAKAWSSLKGNWGLPILALLISTGIASVVTFAGSSIGGIFSVGLPKDLAPSVKDLFGSLTMLFVAGQITFGEAVFFTNFMRGNNVSILDIFAGFKKYGKTLALYLLIELFTTLWSLLFIVPGIIMKIAYSMSFYIMRDNPDLSPNEARKKSIEMMDGHKWRFFCLQLSFTGWLLLCILTLGVLVIWVAPVMSAANAAFYDDLKKGSGLVEEELEAPVEVEA